jgi:amino acid transporter
VRLITVLILIFFCVLTSFGVSDSANVALAMFILHMFVLTLLIIWGFAYGIQDNFSIFHDNAMTHYPTIVSSSGTELARNSGVGSIFFGYSSALLGITGFETASNYCESMKSSKTFVSTVNWMWIIVGIYNPLLSLISLMVLPMDRIYHHSSGMLAIMAKEVGGEGFYILLNVDAVIILCGGVLTSLVGVSGLLKRLAADHILPEVLATTNSRGAPHYAIVVFTVLAISLFLAIFDPSNPTAINDFGGVFAISFLSVLISFASAAVLLKMYRPLLARRVVSKWWQVILSLLAVVAGFLGNTSLHLVLSVRTHSFTGNVLPLYRECAVDAEGVLPLFSIFVRVYWCNSGYVWACGDTVVRRVDIASYSVVSNEARGVTRTRTAYSARGCSSR